MAEQQAPWAGWENAIGQSVTPTPPQQAQPVSAPAQQADAAPQAGWEKAMQNPNAQISFPEQALTKQQAPITNPNHAENIDPFYAAAKLTADYIAGKAGAVVGDTAGLSAGGWNTITDYLGSKFGFDPKSLQSALTPEQIQEKGKTAGADIANLMPETKGSRVAGEFITDILSPWTNTTKAIGEGVSNITGSKVIGNTVEDLGNYALPQRLAPGAVKALGVAKAAPILVNAPSAVLKNISASLKDTVSTPVVKSVLTDKVIDWAKVPVDEAGVKIIRGADGKALYYGGTHLNKAGEVIKENVDTIASNTQNPIITKYKDAVEGIDQRKGKKDIIPQEVKMAKIAQVGMGLTAYTFGGPIGAIVATIYEAPRISDLAGAVFERFSMNSLKTGKVTLNAIAGAGPRK